MCCLGEIISNLRVDILDGGASLLAQIEVNRSTAIVFRGPYARFKQCSLRDDRIEIYVRVAWLGLYLGWEDCSRIRKCPEMYSNRVVCAEAGPAIEMEKEERILVSAGRGECV